VNQLASTPGENRTRLASTRGSVYMASRGEALHRAFRRRRTFFAQIAVGFSGQNSGIGETFVIRSSGLIVETEIAVLAREGRQRGRLVKFALG
jgi:hypothetical protein